MKTIILALLIALALTADTILLLSNSSSTTLTYSTYPGEQLVEQNILNSIPILAG